jgi:hypothetical protein
VIGNEELEQDGAAVAPKGAAASPLAMLVPTDEVFAVWARDVDVVTRLEDGFVWSPRAGMGALPVTPLEYNAAYFDNYAALARTPMGFAITEARVELVRRFYGTGHLVDVGIGAGAFLEARQIRRGWTWGYDVNPVAIDWIKRRSSWRDPYEAPVTAVSLWDVLEHIPNPARLLGNVHRWVFMSCPIWRGDVEAGPDPSWRHYKPAEHCWYWTRDGLTRWFAAHGFVCRYAGWDETELGRLDVGSFAFERVTR